MPVVNPDARQFRFADVGSALQKKQSLEYGRLRNEALGMDIEETQNMLANRTRANEIRQQFEAIPDQIEQLENDGLFKEADELRASYIDQAKAQVELAKSFSEGLTAENYDEVREGLISEGMIDGDLWPVNYDANWFKENNRTAASSLTKLTRKWYENGAVMAQDIMQRGGEITWEGEPYPAPKTGAQGGSQNYTSGDDNAIRNAIKEEFGGFYDPQTGQWAGLSRDTAQRVTGVAEAATKIFADAKAQGQVPPMTHSIAVAQASRAAGITIEKVGDENKNPLNLSRPEQ